METVSVSVDVPSRERRVPGYLVVIVLALAAMLASLPALFLRPTTPEGPSFLLVTATDAIAYSPPSIEVVADFGPRCPGFEWDPDRRILTVEADVDLRSLDGVILLAYAPRSGSFLYDGLVKPVFARDGAGWTVESPLGPRTLFRLEPSGQDVAHDGAIRVPGASWSLQISYPVILYDEEIQVVEDITFRNEGIVQARIVPSQTCT